MQRLTLGAVEVTKVVEWQGEIGPATTIVPESPPGLWQQNESWLAPDHWRPHPSDPDGGAVRAAVQTWVLRSEGKTILIDTGIGNDRDRPQVPAFDHLRTGYLDRLAEAGVAPGDVDLVINTHIHYDHVGWNTRLEDGEWAPAFPNATYLIPRADKEYFDPGNGHLRRRPRDDAERLRWTSTPLVYRDSIVPVLGQAVLWEDSYRVDGNLTLEPAPGHTPGSCVVRLSSESHLAVFAGDLLHSPAQILDPRHSSCFCEDPREAAIARRRILERAADRAELVIPAHFAGASAATVQRDGSGFAIARWAE